MVVVGLLSAHILHIPICPRPEYLTMKDNPMSSKESWSSSNSSQNDTSHHYTAAAALHSQGKPEDEERVTTYQRPATTSNSSHRGTVSAARTHLAQMGKRTTKGKQKTSNAATPKSDKYDEKQEHQKGVTTTSQALDMLACPNPQVFNKWWCINQSYVIKNEHVGVDMLIQFVINGFKHDIANIYHPDTITTFDIDSGDQRNWIWVMCMNPLPTFDSITLDRNALNSCQQHNKRLITFHNSWPTRNLQVHSSWQPYRVESNAPSLLIMAHKVLFRNWVRCCTRNVDRSWLALVVSWWYWMPVGETWIMLDILTITSIANVGLFSSGIQAFSRSYETCKILSHLWTDECKMGRNLLAVICQFSTLFTTA